MCGLPLVIYSGSLVVNRGVSVFLHLPGRDLHVDDAADLQPGISQVRIPTLIETVVLSSRT